MLVENWHDGWEDGVQFYPLHRRKFGFALEEDARTVDPHVIYKNMGHPNFLIS
jgi:hypothetical protein